MAELAGKRKEGGVIPDQFERGTGQREVESGSRFGRPAARIHERGSEEQDQTKSTALRARLAHVVKLEPPRNPPQRQESGLATEPETGVPSALVVSRGKSGRSR